MITSNIHCNIVAWQASHAYSVLGVRVTNAGNAYQVITTGTSAGSGGPTTTGVNITDGTVHWKYLSAADFASIDAAALQAWADALANPLTDDVTGLLWNNGTITATLNTTVLFLGARTLSAFTTTVRPAPGEGIFDAGRAVLAFDAARGVSFTLPNVDSTSFAYLFLEDRGIVLDGFQFRDPRATGGSSILASVGVGSVYRNLIFDGYGRATNKMVELGGVSVIDNCLLVERGTASSFNLLGLSAAPSRVVNCLLVSVNNVGTSQALFCEGAGNVGHVISNTGIFGWSAAQPIASDAAGAITADHCITDSANLNSALDGGGNLVSKTLANQVVSATTDFRLKAGADCLRAGAVSTDSATSIFGLARGMLTDIGPDQVTVMHDAGAIWPFGLGFATDGSFGPLDDNLEFSRTVTRDFGAIWPFSPGFATDGSFGPTGDNTLAFDSVIVRDYATSIDPRLSVIHDVAVPIANDQTALIVTSGPVVMIEWLRSVASLPVGPAEWRGAATRDFTVPEFFAAQFVTDRATPTEWGLSARADVVTPIDFNMTRQATPTVNAEWRATFLRDDATATEPDATAALNVAPPTEWMTSALVVTATVPAEFTALCVYDLVTPTEPGATTRADAIVPVDWGQPAQTSASFDVPAEFVNRIFAVHPEPEEFSTARARDATAPAEWTGSTATTLNADASAEWRGTFAADYVVFAEWSTAFVVDAVTPSAWVSTIFVDPAVSQEASLSVAADLGAIWPWGPGFATDGSFGPTGGNILEWLTTIDAVTLCSLSFGSGVPRDVAVPVAITGSATGATGDAAAPLAFGGGLASTSLVVPSEWTAGTARDALIFEGWLSTMLSEPETVAEMTLSIVGESFVVPDSNFDVTTADLAAPTEWSSVALSMSITSQIEYSAVAITDSDGTADWFGTAISADMVALIEWTQDTAMTSADAVAPVDFLSQTVLVDVAVPIERWFDRESIGAGLEPDEWEREHG